ncbi:MAG: hypothetical protein E7019_05400 [Alphaproteobacteria bacterium]|nr:hypothetical protein [Alphaproteobacteria bacterium]
MKIFAFILSFALVCSSAWATFIDGLEDVPIMEGLVQIQNDNISFGNEESRLVQAVLSGKNFSFAEVEKFYQKTLPQMGWIYQGKRENTIIFEREGEIMEIKNENASPLRIIVTVKSKI